MPSGRFSEPRKVLRATLYSTGIGRRRISTLRLMPSAVSLVISIFSAARYFFSRSLMNGSNGVAIARVPRFIARMASITLDMSVIAADHRRDAGLVDDVDVEIRQLPGRPLHALDGFVHVVVGELLDRQRHGGHVDAFGHGLVELQHRARRNRSGKDHPDVQPPSGNAFSHADAPDGKSMRDHCGTLAPVAAMTSLHFLVSAVITACISTGVLPTTSRPCSVKRSFSRASAAAFCTSAESRSTMSCGVFAGASNPNQPASS